MTHRFPIKEIARQAGVGPATVDRVLNGRAHVSAQTKARVTAAITELEAQESLLAARGRRMFFDFVMEAPDRFSREVKTAVETVTPEISAAVCRARFRLAETMSDEEVVATLNRIARRGSHGLCLKARDSAPIRAAVARLAEVGIPTVALVTDVTGRVAYVGVDNASAGRTAALLMGLKLTQGARVLATRSGAEFSGEEERLTAFRDALAHYAPGVEVLDFSGGGGVYERTARLLSATLAKVGAVHGVYSMGGANRAILDAMDAAHLNASLFVAHDLDRANRALIASGAIDIILHHDLRADMQNVFRAFLHHHRLVAGQPEDLMSPVQVITRENCPPR
ncbi:LacI family DNA-binding transcriptional regulator [Pontivivens insulae]|uniref:HTH-type transcriptional regulator MalR n=1 Tax=Pontivivens insulae TaxID=1639689 RepID=A0A2R8ADV9_9RHOB|nr:LacI family DNA-binding transcriptional regulator [Pontivivens insulae]RED14175.1 LacI family transcriptional regulator [Pontivivens insulae]SPF30250.1 HTH-type transcriptional regulator MalR [Pontivivens insulae]